MARESSTVVRTELIGIVRDELLGPRGDKDGEIPASPRAMYAVGGLAPVTIDPSLARLDSDVDDAESQGVDGAPVQAISDADPDHPGQPGVPVPTDEDFATADSDDEEDAGPKGALTHPSSMGLRFQVPVDAAALVVTASWGRYGSFQRLNEETGRKRTWFRRTPVEVAKEVDLAGTDARRNEVLELDQDVSLRVEVFPLGDRLIVELALSNDRVTGVDAPPGDWLFQTELSVEAMDGSACFLPSRDVCEPGYQEADPERRRLDLQYKHKLEYAVGRTCSVDWKEAGDQRRATKVMTTWLPTADVPQTVAGAAGQTVTAMRVLADIEAGDIRQALEPMVSGYVTWLGEDQEKAARSLPDHLKKTASDAIGDARIAASRLEAGLALLESDPDTLKAFRFMNRAMRDQRIRSQVAAKRAAKAGVTVEQAIAEVEAEGDKAASWRPFQLAFIVMQLPALVDPTDPYRSGDDARVELLFFPTGGGKTEAYLGLAAFTFAIRRLQGTVQGGDGELDGGDGVAVLMRYTLRLLTSQQFQRAAALVCAAELIRQEDAATWGSDPFRIGLWVGSSVSPKRFTEAQAQVQLAKSEDGRAHGLTVLQIKRCPWCGTPIDPKRDVDAVATTQRIHVYCGDRDEECPFSGRGPEDEGLPILTVDEEIYRHPPTFLLATVDKFARLAREGEAASLFGYVAERCERHGYRHPDARGDFCKGQKHNAITKGGVAYPAVEVRPVPRLRPPDLIIQDELHLITGALGTAVGVFENVVDVLCSWSRDGQAVLPLIVASTATVRKAEDQVRNLYGRGVDVFPPQVLDVRHTYFSRELEVTPDQPGRKYLGVCAHGIRLTLAEIRIAEVLLLAGQKLLDEHGKAADPYMTSVAYFSATRELAGMRRYLDDDVTTRVSGNTEPFPRRTTDFSRLQIGELTSRISSSEIGATLDRLALEFDPERWSTVGKAAFAKAMQDGKVKGGFVQQPYDFVLATSMLQVGVDVPRLGLMLVVGQPKNTAEYIQASSRVGRDKDKPGLVVSLANWSRPRNMAHFEQFRHYHETFYAQVEALSVTPFSEAALERGLMGVLVSAARVMDVGRPDSLSPELGAGRILDGTHRLDEIIDRLTERASRAYLEPDFDERVRAKLVQRRDRWFGRAQEEQGGLVYERSTDKNQTTQPMLISPEVRTTTPNQKVFVVANSMREVQPEINLLVSPSPDRLAAKEPVDAPGWNFTPPVEEDA
ncbi:DISARM system helicase DrmA [Klenkia sp. PcliD-1-E]|uniref:DISARM system helicase DrmA n=1 Tax=Klenkia sp. PcliD-1-E TaxID=2954492 RepID=UPI002098086F|nr:DISARM system helicase DrmA [Klenkia sp. PcliD-1-E]MCO7218476.1 DISARM system helicase DrmA [Klenkia sp. PcliD-1-E]